MEFGLEGIKSLSFNREIAHSRNNPDLEICVSICSTDAIPDQKQK